MKRNKLRLLILVSLIFTLTITDNMVGFSSKISPNYTVEAATNTVTLTTKNNVKYAKFNGKSYKIEKVDGGNLSGKRISNVAVDIGYGSRTYWGFTNKYGQLVYVVADKITLQNPKTDKVLTSGRYYKDEAKVPGVERKDLDEGHVIADSLGGVSNAYNITPQDSTQNRHGDQAYMEKNIRDAGGCSNFKAIITYPNSKTQIPSHYHYTYTLKGNDVTEDFDNVNPDKVNKNLNNVTPTPKPNNSNSTHSIDAIDRNHDGKVTIAEAKAAGYKMPITKDDWLYKYMDDRDGDGLVGE